LDAIEVRAMAARVSGPSSVTGMARRSVMKRVACQGGEGERRGRARREGKKKKKEEG
jgi:hypothetical protein